jgi:ribosome biogenesis GTPase / thiamine phosphate phosphatase
MGLEALGYNAWFAKQVDPEEGLTVARVTAVHKGESEVCDGEETRSARMTGRMRHQARTKVDYPTVGDWVLVKHFEDEEQDGRIERILERQSALLRKTAGRRTIEQLIAANIDVAFIMQTLGKGFNLRRIERYLVMVNDSGIKPVVLLSKSDLVPAEETTEKVAEVAALMPGVEIYPFSNETEEGLEAVEALFEPQHTYCLIGTSGVGKTTLLNKLLGEEDFLFTLPVREKDGKGVHSTTWRELITLDNGALVIDTPGMRELGNLNTGDGITETFDDIATLAAGCQFTDCSHVNTKGCAVMTAVEAGEVVESRYQNFVRLEAEKRQQTRDAREKKVSDQAANRFHRSMTPGGKRKKGRS